MIIRPATAKDCDQIDHIHRSAFAATPFGHNGEAQLVRQLQADGDVVASIVAERGGHLVGHALFNGMSVDADGLSLKAAALAPVAVLPENQGEGVGSALIEAGISALRKSGFQISFVLGHPDYYPRFGYRPELAAPFASPYAGEHFMALYLDTGLSVPQEGKAEYAPAFARME